MKHQPNTGSDSSVNIKALFISRSITIIINVAISAGILFFAAGEEIWPFAWLYIFSYLTFQLISLYVAIEHDQLKEDSQNRSLWDRILGVSYSLTHPLTLILAGFEFSLTRNPHAFGLTIQCIAYAFLILTFALIVWAQSENPCYYSSNMAIQPGQKVITTGPYQFIRHPGYAGLFMLSLARPLVLGSRLGFLAGMVGATLVILRTILEDRTMQNDNTDYKQYAQTVRYRIFSNFW